MSTHCNIGIRNKNGGITYIYVHFDGYEDYAGYLLRKFYSGPRKAKALIDLGDIDSVAPRISDIKAFRNDNIAWEECKPKLAHDLRHFLREEYAYLWDGKKWVGYYGGVRIRLPVSSSFDFS